MREQVVGGIVFNPEACNGCGRCVESCPLRAWGMSGKRNRRGVYPARFLGAGCGTCGTCYYFCPELGAITLTPHQTPSRVGRYLPAA
jgi:ferredoxin